MMPEIYLIIGSAGSGRRRFTTDLAVSSLEKDQKNLIAVSINESPIQVATDTNDCIIDYYQWKGDKPFLGKHFQSCQRLFWILDSTVNIIDQIENIYHWLKAKQLQLVRILSIIDCSLVFKNPFLKQWAKACIHFSDVVLLNHYDHLDPKFLNNYLKELKKELHPYILKYLKNDIVDNPTEVLYNEARRACLIFDQEEDYAMPDLEAGYTGSLSLKRQEDPYFERTEGFLRKIHVPNPF